MENFIVSARKYRPATFATVVGQDAITNTLKNAIRNHQVAQAFLFTGPRGVGKTTCARILAKTINCRNITPEGEACNVCPSCQSFNNTSSFNIFELDAASNNSVDDIRTLVDQVRIIPQEGYKVYIIDEVHMLTTQAFNAFLKTLEEPPAYAKFILATTEKHKILPTILSRCQIFDFRRISIDDIATHLKFVADSEGIETEPEALHIIAQKADGGLRDALSMFDQLVSYAGNQLTYKQVIDNLNVLDYEYYFRITDAILSSDVSSALIMFNEIMDNGFEGQHFITGLGEHFRNLLVSKDVITLKLLETSKSVKEQYASQSALCSVPFIFRALDILNTCDINYKTSNNKKLHIEIALMQLCGILSEPADQTSQKPASQPIAPPPPVKTQPSTPSPSTSQASKSSKQATPPASSGTAQSTTENITSPDPETGNEIKTEEDIQGNSAKYASGEKPVTANASPSVTKVKEATTSQGRSASSLTGLALGDLLNGKKPEKEITISDEDEEVPAASYGNEHVSLSDLLKIWPQMVEKVTEGLPMLQHTLLNQSPELLDNDIININIVNALQDEDIFKYKRKITAFLRKELKNGKISLQTTIKEIATESKKPYTDTEKFIFLAEKAPALKKLKDQLGLELDM